MRKKGVWWQWAQWGSAPLKLWPYNRPWSIIYITDSQYSIINIFWLELVRHNEWRQWGLKHVCQFWFWLWKKENMKKTSINCFQPVIGWSVHQSNSPALLFVSSTAWCSLRMRSFLCLGRLNWAGHMLVFPLREAPPCCDVTTSESNTPFGRIEHCGAVSACWSVTESSLNTVNWSVCSNWSAVCCSLWR